jgi:hypothetical protein
MQMRTTTRQTVSRLIGMKVEALNSATLPSL